MTWAEVKTIAEAEFTSGRLVGKEYASFLLGALQTQMQIDAEAGVRAAQIASETSRKALMDQQKLTEVQQTSKAAYEVAHILPAQKTHTENQALMVARQTTAFDDKKRVEQATQAGGLVGMIYASGGDVPTDAWTYAKGKVDAI